MLSKSGRSSLTGLPGRSHVLAEQLLTQIEHRNPRLGLWVWRTWMRPQHYKLATTPNANLSNRVTHSALGTPPPVGDLCIILGNNKNNIPTRILARNASMNFDAHTLPPTATHPTLQNLCAKPLLKAKRAEPSPPLRVHLAPSLMTSRIRHPRPPDVPEDSEWLRSPRRTRNEINRTRQSCKHQHRWSAVENHV